MKTVYIETSVISYLTALAAYHGVDYLLTWNCRHLDNAEMKPVMRSMCAIHGYACPRAAGSGLRN